VLEIGRGCRDCAEGPGVQRTAGRREEADARRPARDLESSARDVLVRDTISEQVQERPDQQGASTRTGEDARRRSARDVERDDHLRSGERAERPRRTGSERAGAPVVAAIAALPELSVGEAGEKTAVGGKERVWHRRQRLG